MKGTPDELLSVTLSLDDWVWLLIRLEGVKAQLPAGVEEGRLNRVIGSLKGEILERLEPIYREVRASAHKTW